MTIVSRKLAATAAPTVSDSSGLTWSQVTDQEWDTAGTRYRLTTYVVKTGGSPSSGQITASYATNDTGIIVTIDEVDGADISGLATAAIVQTKLGPVDAASNTSLTITLDSAIGSGNASWGAFVKESITGTVSAGSGYTKTSDQTIAGAAWLFTEYQAAGSTTVDASWSATGVPGGVAAEIKAAAQAFTGTAAATLPHLTASATGQMEPSGTGTATLPHLTVSATGVEEPSGTAAATLPSLTASATGISGVIEGTAAPTLPHLTASAAGQMEPSGMAAATLPHLTASGTAVEEPSGTGAATLPHLRASASGIAISPTTPTPEKVRFGYIVSPSVTYDGTGLVNRVIPIGVDADGGNLTLQWANPSPLPYAILNDGDSWYIQDSTSIGIHGLYEQKVYRTDIRVPEKHTNEVTGLANQPFGLDEELLTIGTPPTAGDTLTLGSRTYTFTATAPGVAADEIQVGADAFDSMDNIVAAVDGTDGYNAANDDVSINETPRVKANGAVVAVLEKDQSSQECAGTSTDGVAKGTDVPIAADFTAPTDNFLGGGVPDTNPPDTSPPATAPTELGGGVLGELTANVLYWTAVNMLLKGRSEFLGLRCMVANGGDIWALPGDRMHVRYEGWAETDEAQLVNQWPKITWLSIDDPMVIVERHDRSDASGVRQVEFVLARPELAYTIPGVPTWPDDDPSGDTPEALPIPGGLDSVNDATSAIDSPPDYLGNTLPKVIAGNGLPFGSSNCCPCSPTDITSSTNQGPPSAASSQSLTGGDLPTVAPDFVPPGDTVTASEAWSPTRNRVVVVSAIGYDSVPTLTGTNVRITQLGSEIDADSGDSGIAITHCKHMFWFVEHDGFDWQDASWSVFFPSNGTFNAYKFDSTQPWPAMQADISSQLVTQGVAAPFTANLDVLAGDDLDSQEGDAFVGFAWSNDGSFLSSFTSTWQWDGSNYADGPNKHGKMGTIQMPSTISGTATDGTSTGTDNLYLLLAVIRLRPTA